jgi:soluble lytic murein transglycosylase-like protein
MGGGAKGIENFAAYLDKATVGLEYLGKDGKKAAAALLGGMNRAGMSMLNPDKNVQGAYMDNLQTLTKQYGTLSNIFGDSAEEFASYYEQIYKSDSLQSKLNAGNTQDLAIQMREISSRTEHLRLLGLTNEQLLAMNKRMEDMFHKDNNAQSDVILKRYYAQQAFSQAAQLQGGPEGAEVQRFIQSGQMNQVMGMSPQDIQKFISNNPALVKSLSTVVDSINSKRASSGQGAGSYYGFGAIDLLQRSGDVGSAFLQAGRDLKGGENKGFTEGKKTDLLNSANENMLKGENGEYTASGKTFIAMRDSVEQVTSLLGSSFADALRLATASVLAFGGVNGIGSLLSLFGKGTGIRVALQGLASLGGAGAIGGAITATGAGIAGAGIAGATAGSLLYDNAIAGTSFGDWLGESIAKAISPFSANAAQAVASTQAMRLNQSVAPKTYSPASTPAQINGNQLNRKQNAASFLDGLEKQYNLPAGTLDAMWAKESGRGTTKGPSWAGAVGDFQFMPAAAKDYGLTDPNDFSQSATAAAKYMSNMLKKYNGNLPLVLAAYNGGPGNVDKLGLAGMPAESQNYASTITSAVAANPANQGQQFNSVNRLITPPGMPPQAATPMVNPSPGTFQATPIAELQKHTSLLQQLVSIMARSGQPHFQQSRQAALANN